VIRTRIAPVALGLLLAGCADKQFDDAGGLKVVRSTCPAVAIPAYTGDITLFSPAQSHDARAFDVSATITNMRTRCDQSGAIVKADVDFDVIARRSSASGARDLVLPYFVTVMRGGTRIMSKQESRVSIHFDDGQLRGTGRGVGGAEIQKALASLPPTVFARLNRKRKATDSDASIDPMADPQVRATVNQANFELLIGFALNEDQLAYNATR
jgi:hypothetical protein